MHGKIQPNFVIHTSGLVSPRLKHSDTPVLAVKKNLRKGGQVPPPLNTKVKGILLILRARFCLISCLCYCFLNVCFLYIFLFFCVLICRSFRFCGQFNLVLSIDLAQSCQTCAHHGFYIIWLLISLCAHKSHFAMRT